MKKFILFLVIMNCAISVQAQVTTRTDTTNVVFVTYNGNSAAVEVCTNIVSYVTATINGANVKIAQSASVDSTTCGEILYVLSGSSANGSFYMEGAYKASFSLDGLTLANPSGPAVDIQNGKRIKISIKHDTESTLTDGTSAASNAWKGALQCKGHMEFKGYGTLNVYGNYAHGIWTKEYIQVKNCTINVCKAVNDAVNCNQYFLMESGVMNLSGFGGDGIQVSKKTDSNGIVIADAENTGNFTMTGGAINIDMTASDGDAVKIEGVQSIAAEATLNTGWKAGLEGVTSDSKDSQAKKRIVDGMLLIERNGRVFNARGAVVK